MRRGLQRSPSDDLVSFRVLRKRSHRHTTSAFWKRTRTRTNTNPNDTEANAAGRSVRACVARKSKSEAEALFKQKLSRKWGHAAARGWATLLLGRMGDSIVDSCSLFCGRKLLLRAAFLERREAEGHATLDRYCHFHGRSDMRSLLARTSN